MRLGKDGRGIREVSIGWFFGRMYSFGKLEPWVVLAIFHKVFTGRYGWMIRIVKVLLSFYNDLTKSGVQSIVLNFIIFPIRFG